MVSSDGRLNITAGGLCCRSCVDGRGLPGLDSPRIRDSPAAFLDPAKAQSENPAWGGGGFYYEARGRASIRDQCADIADLVIDGPNPRHALICACKRRQK